MVFPQPTPTGYDVTRTDEAEIPATRTERFNGASDVERDSVYSFR